MFRQKIIASKEVGSKAPIIYMSKATFIYTRENNVFFVAVTKSNANPALVLEYLYQKIRICKAYFKKVEEDSIKNNMTLLYELMDETMDFGYPQLLAIDVLRSFINLGTVNVLDDQDLEPNALTAQITGAIDWRRPGLRYRKNEVYIDVLESVNLLMSTNGTVLENNVTGQVIMKTALSGMPECRFGLNDKLIMERDSSASARAVHGAKKGGVAIDDCTFHRCVRLGKFDADRTITFVPPDGEFELMRYRVTDNIHCPFQVVPAVQEEGRSRVSITVKVMGKFGQKLYATNVVIKIPVPPNTAKCKIHCAVGRARYEPEQRAIVWRTRRFTGGAEAMLSADVELMASIRPKPWSRPPISLEFQVPMFTASGVHVRFLRVFDKSGYVTNRWVRYITRAGNYQIRI